MLVHFLVDLNACTTYDNHISVYNMLRLTHCICYDIRFTRMVVQSEVVVGHILLPSPLSHIEIPLTKDVAHTLMIKEEIKLLPTEIVPLSLLGLNRCG